MKLSAYRLSNYRRLDRCVVELDDELTIFVGANNSGKTSAAQALHAFLNSEAGRFSLNDFSVGSWKKFDDEGVRDGANARTLPSINLDLWFRVTEAEFYLVMPLLPSVDWKGSEVGLRIAYEPNDADLTVQRFREARRKAKEHVEKSGRSYDPWPRSLSDYLRKELRSEYGLR